MSVQSSIRRRVASNTAVQIAGKGAVLLLGAASIAVLTRYLGPDDYGNYTLALMYMQLFAVLADVGLYTTVVREISKPPGAHRGAGRQHADAAAAAVDRGDRAGPAISLLLPYEPDVRVAILLAGAPLLFGMLTSSFVASSRRGCGWAARWSATWSGARPPRAGAAGGRARPRLLRRDGRGGGGAATLVVTWLAHARPVARARFAPSRRSGARCWAGPAARPGAGHQRALLPRGHADHLALRAVRRGRALHARVPHPRVHAGARDGLPDTVFPLLSEAVPATSRARGARSRPPPTCS